jgi:hypothetical protein
VATISQVALTEIGRLLPYRKAYPNACAAYNFPIRGIGERRVRVAAIYSNDVSLLLLRPENRLGNHDVLAVERGCRRAVELVSQRKGVGDSPTEFGIVFASEQPISRKTLGRRGFRHGEFLWQPRSIDSGPTPADRRIPIASTSSGLTILATWRLTSPEPPPSLTLGTLELNA